MEPVAVADMNDDGNVKWGAAAAGICLLVVLALVALIGWLVGMWI